MSNSDQVVIQPVEDFVLKGFQQRFTQVFGCRGIFVTATDRIAALKRLTGGAELQYPFAFFSMPSMVEHTASYSVHHLSRFGLYALVGDGSASRVRLMPTKFEFEIEYITNKADGAKDSVKAFMKRWMFAKRLGYLKFNIGYGRLNLSVGCELSDITSVPQRENITESESSYKLTANIALLGYTSEEVLRTVGVVQSLEVDGLEYTGKGTVVSSQQFSF